MLILLTVVASCALTFLIYWRGEVKMSAGDAITPRITGVMNTPVSPGRLGQVCVDVPDVKEGQTIEFRLPKSDYSDQTFVTCYKKGSGDYFIRQK